MDRQFFELTLARAWSFRRVGNGPMALEQAKKVMEVAIKTDPECVMIAREFLAVAHETVGDYQAALEHHQLNLDAAEKILRRHPDDVIAVIIACSAYAGIGQLYFKRERFNEAEKLFDKLYGITFRRLIADPSDVLGNRGKKRLHAMSCEYLADLYLAMEDASRAVLYAGEFNLLMVEVFQDDDTDLEVQGRVMRSHVLYGSALILVGRHDEAAARYHISRQLAEELAAKYPDVYEFTGQLLFSLESLAELLTAQGSHSEALSYFLQEYQLIKQNLEKYPEENGRRYNMAVAACRIGETYIHLNQLALAKPFLDEANCLFLELVSAPSNRMDYYRGLNASYRTLSTYFKRSGDLHGAKVNRHESLKVIKLLVSNSPEIKQHRQSLRNCYNDLAELYAASNDPVSAKHFADFAEKDPFLT